MSPWKPLLASLGLAALLAATARADAPPVPFQGLAVAAAGASVAGTTADHRLVVSNIGSSGQDGVDVDCARLDGFRCSPAATVADADVGASVTASFRYRVGASPATRGEWLQCTVHATSLDYMPALDPVVQAAASGQVLRVRMRLTLTTETVYAGTLAPGEGASVRRAAGAAAPLGALSCYIDRASRAECCAVEFASPRTCVVNGVDVTCDAIVFSVDSPLGADALGVDGGVRVAAPPGSSLASCAFSRLDAVALDHFVSGLGPSSLQGEVVSGQRRLRLQGLSSGGEDGVAVTRVPSHVRSDASVVLRFAHPSLTWSPSLDDGASSVTRVHGSSSVTSDGVLATQAITMVGNAFSMHCDFSGIGADAESVMVENQGAEVARFAVAPGSSVLVQPTTTGPLAMAINQKGLPGEKPKNKTTTARTPAGVGPNAAEAADAGAPDELPFVLGFRTPRVFVVGGQSVTGDRIHCWGLRRADTGGALHVTSQDEVIAPGSSSSSQHDVELLDIAGALANAVSVDVPASTSLSGAHGCVRVPVVFHQNGLTRTQAFSVSFHLSPELSTCGVGIAEGDYLSSFGATQMFVTNHGGGAYTVDGSMLGPVCTAQGDGTLFALELSAVQPVTSATGVVVVDSVRMRDCANLPMAVSAGAPGFVPIDFTTPAAPSGLVATQVRTGNPAGATTGVALAWSPPAALDAAVTVFRKGFGDYPAYGRGSTPRSEPSPPGSPDDALASGWSLAGCRAPGDVDRPSSRDFEYYCAFVTDVFGNTSPCSAVSNGVLDYHLGDVSDGVATCTGDDRVTIADVSFLGAHYGQAVAAGSSFACLDVGPTTDFSPLARPEPDGRVEFEDFMMFALDWSVVSAPQTGRVPAPAPVNAARLVAPALPAVGATFDVGVNVDAAGDAQGLSLRFEYDHAVLELVGAEAGALLGAQDRPGLALPSADGGVDVALLGAGGGLSGTGELARVRFRVVAAGDPRLAIASVTARDARNRPVSVSAFAGGAGATARPGLAFAFPDPFRAATDIHLSLARAGVATLAVYDVAGRRVRTLFGGAQPSGPRTVRWDGRDDSGVRQSPGAYIVRLESGGRSESRLVRLVR